MGGSGASIAEYTPDIVRVSQLPRVDATACRRESALSGLQTGLLRTFLLQRPAATPPMQANLIHGRVDMSTPHCDDLNAQVKSLDNAAEKVQIKA